MKRINILDENTSNKIAAGEVVERPYSVVKELIENSIDAQASNITIEIEEGGQKKIKITDDGFGIHPDDIGKAFLTHATSKISCINDIFNVQSMGFRGEALASIAAVARVNLKSKQKGFDFGREIFINGGNIEYIKDCGTNLGTVIEVSDLFFNVPARLKFLKSSQRESALINEIVSKLALSHNEITFKLISNGKNVMSTYRSEDMKDTIREIYDKNICDNLIEFEEHLDQLSVYGYIGTEEIARGSRNNQSIFINKRYIKSKLIVSSVENAYKSFMTVNKFPFFILFLDIYPEYIDVNVHPTKSEVKFRDERSIYKITFDAVHSSLKNSRVNSFLEEEKQTTISVALPLDLNSEKFDSKINNYPTTYEKPIDIEKEFQQTIPEKVFEKEPIAKKLPDIRLIGQFHNTYILGEYKDELYLIDQHAAHEKFLFEKFMKEIKDNEIISQILLEPLVLELSSADFELYSDNKTVFKSTGFLIEDFGDNTINIKEVPIFLGKPDLKDLFFDIIDNIKSMGSGQTTEVKYKKIATLSCKAAVKGNNELKKEEMLSLIEDMKYMDDPFNCPHGRPTIIKLSLTEIEKKFRRIV